MCGITGYWVTAGEAVSAELAITMAQRLAHRGPDDCGVWLDEQAGLALAHRRLSIIDLSAAGHQPMISPCGRYVLNYNGEIYNHRDLRTDLEREGGHFDWRGHSDSETLLAALRHWGVDQALRRLNGMFAFVLWDREQRQLILARDRMGEKPLYYGRIGDTFLFGSELKALCAHPEWRGDVDRDALALYLRYSYVPAPHSIYKGIRKLPPARYVVVREGGKKISDPRCYWDLAVIATAGSAHAGDDSETLIDELDELLRNAVGIRMAADVPLGTFLSGGYDSSTIAAIMQAQSPQPVKTFSIGFHEKDYNEAKYAKAVACHLGTDHTELYVSSDEAMAVIPKLPEIWDEPFSDPSQIPTYLVSQLARRHVKVCLSGDGGDELFCGYNRYVLGYRVWKLANFLPARLRKPLAYMLENTPIRGIEWLINCLPAQWRVPQVGDRIPKLTAVLRYGDGQSFYRDLTSQWKQPERVVLDGHEPPVMADIDANSPELSEFQERMMYWDALTYLPGDILVKMDRASMAVSLEGRIPLLDHRIVELAWRVPMTLKYQGGQGKWLLRQVLYRYIPKHLLDRPKAGFNVPIGQWLRGPLRDWAETLLDEKKLCEEGFFAAAPIRQAWNGHIVDKANSAHRLWNVLMFQAWLKGY